MAVLPLARFAPDKAKYNTEALSTVNNVVPATDGWKPLKQIVQTTPTYDYLTDELGNYLTDEDGNRLVVASDYSGLSGELALPDDCTALFVASKRDGTEQIFAGTETGLFRFESASFTWLDVSSTTYASAVPWVFAQFGDYVFAQNGFNVEQKFDLENDADFSDNTGAPICKTIRTVGNFLWRADLVSWAAQSMTTDPKFLQCSALENPLDNVPRNLNSSDYQSLPLGTNIQVIIPFGTGGHIRMRDAWYGFNITLDSVTFTTFPIDLTRGTPAPYSVALLGQDDYVIYCDDGFWRVTAGGTKNIGEGKVNATFLADCDQDLRHTIRAALDPENLVCWWSYTDNDGNRKRIGYHYIVDEWTMSDADVVASVAARTFIYGATITQAGQLRAATIDSDGILGFQVGSNAAAEFGTNEVLHHPTRSFVNGLRLITDAPTYSVVVTTRDTLGGSTRARSAATPSSRSGLVPVRADGRNHKYDFTIAAGTSWTTATVADVEVKASGRS